MSRENIRYKFLDILIDQKIGDINKPNVLGLLPHQMDHFQPLRNLPDHILSHLPATIQEIQEADYVIITPEDKKEIILDELQELKLYYPDDHKKNLVHQFFYEENKIDPVNFLKSRGSTKLIQKQNLCAIAVKVPIDLLNDHAQELMIESSIT